MNNSGAHHKGTVKPFAGRMYRLVDESGHHVGWMRIHPDGKKDYSAVPFNWSDTPIEYDDLYYWAKPPVPPTKTDLRYMKNE